MRTVEVAPLRAEFIRRRDAGEVSPCDVAVRLGWTRRKVRHDRGGRVYVAADSSRVLRYLGMTPMVHHGNLYGTRARVRYETAVILAEAIGVDPTDVGL